ncbi:MAG: hypothetical protein WD851_19600 [Pirellulales bacterium]
MNSSTQAMLIRRLAALEAAWKPLRGHEWSSGAAICEARRTGGVRAWGESGDARHRKADQRSRDEAMASGFLRGDTLTREGKAAVRGWVMPFSPVELERAIFRLSDHLAAGDYMPSGDGCNLVPEVFIAGADWGVAIALVQRLFVPLIADGVLIGRTTFSGRAFYGFAGDGPVDIPSIVASVFGGEKFDARLADIYDTEFPLCRRRILADNEKYQEIGEIPLVVESLASGREHHDLTDIEPLFTDSDSTPKTH